MNDSTKINTGIKVSGTSLDLAAWAEVSQKMAGEHGTEAVKGAVADAKNGNFDNFRSMAQGTFGKRDGDELTTKLKAEMDSENEGSRGEQALFLALTTGSAYGVDKKFNGGKFSKTIKDGVKNIAESTGLIKSDSDNIQNPPDNTDYKQPNETNQQKTNDIHSDSPNKDITNLTQNRDKLQADLKELSSERDVLDQKMKNGKISEKAYNNQSDVISKKQSSVMNQLEPLDAKMVELDKAAKIENDAKTIDAEKMEKADIDDTRRAEDYNEDLKNKETINKKIKELESKKVKKGGGLKKAAVAIAIAYATGANADDIIESVKDDYNEFSDNASSGRKENAAANALGFVFGKDAGNDVAAGMLEFSKGNFSGALSGALGFIGNGAEDWANVGVAISNNLLGTDFKDIDVIQNRGTNYMQDIKKNLQNSEDKTTGKTPSLDAGAFSAETGVITKTAMVVDGNVLDGSSANAKHANIAISL
jgi:hypothetical protein